MNSLRLPRYVLDTNIISAVVHGLPSAADRFSQEMNNGALFLLCPLVWYEMRRGLLRQRTERTLHLFDRLTVAFVWEDLVPEDWQLAASTWPRMVAIGQEPDDADLLIAVFAARRNAMVVTHNQKHFQPLTAFLNIQVEDWI
jgi:predicted nucleic acid-binding protein